MEWYYARGEERVGPIDDAGFEELVATGAITGETLVWNATMSDWQRYGAVATAGVPDTEIPPSLFGESTSQPCAECGRVFASDDMLAYEHHWVCANCKDVFFQRIREGGAPLGNLRYAGFWIRFCARFIDGILVNVVIYTAAFIVGFAGALSGTGGTGEPGAAELIMGLVIIFFSIGLPMTYETYFLGKFGATPGKMAVGLRVVMSDGSPLTYGRSFGRFFAYVLSRLTMYIGCIIAGFDDQKRSLHDHICDTRVVFK